MSLHPSTPSTLFSRDIEAESPRRSYSPLTGLILCVTGALLFVGLVASFRFLWPSLDRTSTEILALVILMGWVFAVRKAGMIPRLAQAEAARVHRAWYFLTAFIGFTVMWIAFSSVHENSVGLDSILGGILTGLFWAGCMTALSR